jgi:hypothetical protein
MIWIPIVCVGSPAILGPSGNRYSYSEETRTRGFASLTLVSFAFVEGIFPLAEKQSILGST